MNYLQSPKPLPVREAIGEVWGLSAGWQFGLEGSGRFSASVGMLQGRFGAVRG